MDVQKMVEENRNELEGYFQPLKLSFDNKNERNLKTISGHNVRFNKKGEVVSVSCHVGKYAGVKCFHDPHL